MNHEVVTGEGPTTLANSRRSTCLMCKHLTSTRELGPGGWPVGYKCRHPKSATEASVDHYVPDDGCPARKV